MVFLYFFKDLRTGCISDLLMNSFPDFKTLPKFSMLVEPCCLADRLSLPETGS
ncbi:hypothetical protein LptCag_0646 [Leptospirillum ferriphilum]|uniref:Uncharacterized protein n=1 Tax=Leptospirillum ferriphilum TaxID=178606 RepID=A0A094WC39_9BACT|nr:hypothetical protein LptCag_0646 [Leptospirillum ferriphilum]